MTASIYGVPAGLSAYRGQSWCSDALGSMCPPPSLFNVFLLLTRHLGPHETAAPLPKDRKL